MIQLTEWQEPEFMQEIADGTANLKFDTLRSRIVKIPLSEYLVDEKERMEDLGVKCEIRDRINKKDKKEIALFIDKEDPAQKKADNCKQIRKAVEV